MTFHATLPGDPILWQGERSGHGSEAISIADRSSKHQELNAFYGDGTFADLKNTTGLTFLTGAGNEDDVLPDPGLTNIGRTPVAEFQRHLAESKALVSPRTPLPLRQVITRYIIADRLRPTLGLTDAIRCPMSSVKCGFEQSWPPRSNYCAPWMVSWCSFHRSSRPLGRGRSNESQRLVE